MVDPEGLRNALRRNPEWARLATFKEIPIVSELLQPTDNILGVGFGWYEDHTGIVIVTETRVLFGGRKVGSILKHTKTEIFDIGKITSVQVNGSSTLSTLIVVTSGAKGEIKSMATAQCKQIADTIRLRLTIVNSPAIPKLTQAPLSFDLSQNGASLFVSELQSLAKLHSDGMLSAEEFASAKAKLLGL